MDGPRGPERWAGAWAETNQAGARRHGAFQKPEPGAGNPAAIRGRWPRPGSELSCVWRRRAAPAWGPGPPAVPHPGHHLVQLGMVTISQRDRPAPTGRSRPPATGSSGSAAWLAATWWRTLATAAGAQAPAFAQRRAQRVVADAKAGVFQRDQVGVGVGGAQHGAVVVGGMPEQHRLATLLEQPGRVRRPGVQRQPVGQAPHQQAAVRGTLPQRFQFRARAETRRAGPSRR
jgi:hypothetical protein